MALTEREWGVLRQAAVGVAQRQGLCPHDAQDCASDFLYSLLELQLRASPTVARFRHSAYCRVSLRRFAARWKRRQEQLAARSHSQEQQPRDEEGGGDPLRGVLRQEAAGQLQQAVSVLSPMVRALLLHRGGEPQEDIPPGVTRVSLFRGRLRVQERLERQGWPESDLRRYAEAEPGLL